MYQIVYAESTQHTNWQFVYVARQYLGDVLTCMSTQIRWVSRSG